MKKKFLALVLCLSMALSLAACVKGSDQKPDDQTPLLRLTHRTSSLPSRRKKSSPLSLPLLTYPPQSRS